jgi:hypothetical protein
MVSVRDDEYSQSSCFDSRLCCLRNPVVLFVSFRGILVLDFQDSGSRSSNNANVIGREVSSTSCEMTSQWWKLSNDPMVINAVFDV